MTRELGKLHRQKLCEFHYSQNNIRNFKKGGMRWAGHVESMGGRRYAYQVVVGKPEAKSSLRMPRRRWGENIKLLNMKRRLLYLKNRFVPRSKHFSSRL